MYFRELIEEELLNSLVTLISFLGAMGPFSLRQESSCQFLSVTFKFQY